MPFSTLTTANLISETRQHLMSMGRDELNTLNGPSGELGVPGASTLTFNYPLGGIVKGAILAIDMELLYVWSISGLTCSAQRAYMGSTEANHVDKSFVYVNPRFSDLAIFNALNEELQSLSSPANGLYRVLSVTTTYNAAVAGYPMPVQTGTFIDVESVSWQESGSSKYWPQIHRYRVDRTPNVAVFGTDPALFVYEGAGSGRALQINYKARFSAFSATLTALVSATGIYEEMVDILPLGAAARLLSYRESRRSQFDSQPEPRAAAESPPGASRNAAAGFLMLRNQRIREEAARLAQWYPRYSRRAV